MVIYDNTTILLAVIGLVGILSTGIIVTYAFARNQTGTGKFNR